MPLSHRFATFAGFCRRVWALTAPYFRSEQRWRAWGMLAAIVALNLAAVYMLVELNEWNRVFYDALQNKDAGVFWAQLGRFCWLAFGLIVISVYRFYLTQLLEMRWREWMTQRYLGRWLSDQSFYRIELARYTAGGPGTSPDNPDQRIQQDLNLFTSQTISLSMGLLNALVTLVSFVGILWGLSGAFAFEWGDSTYSIPGFMVWAAVAYCGVGSVLSHWIGRPQAKLNFEQERLEANFRHHLVRVREYSESIALDRGEAVEQGQLRVRFDEVLVNYLKLLRAQKNLTWFTVGFGQAAVVFPFVVAAPRFFSGAIQLGELIQISSAFGRVQDSLSWFVDNYANLASWKATTDRLTGFEETFERVAHANTKDLAIKNAASEGACDTLQATDLTVSLPSGQLLLAQTDLQAHPGDTVLLQGPSGSGKSTLFRTLAGIWPHASGHVTLPCGSMFLPQRPYIPNGRLRDALAYPAAAATHSDGALKQALTDAMLPHLCDRLDVEDAWGQKLSGGEQQRLAVARALLQRPRWVFADEATSALDEATEAVLYQRLRDLVRATGGGVVSIAHRPAVAAYHQRQWVLTPQPEGAAPAYRLDSRPAV